MFSCVKGEVAAIVGVNGYWSHPITYSGNVTAGSLEAIT